MSENFQIRSDESISGFSFEEKSNMDIMLFDYGKCNNTPNYDRLA